MLWDYLELGLFPEQIATRYRTLSIEQVYATIKYYWLNREQLDTYLQRVTREIERQRSEQDAHPSPAVLRLRRLVELRSQLPAA